jgi:2-dehydro-3-deoxygluconokinase
MQAAAALGPKLIVLKLAERGALALAEGTAYKVPAVPVERTIDPVGAGDGFNAGFLAGWLRGDSMEESLRLGARIGAAAVSTLGDYAGYPRFDLDRAATEGPPYIR